MFAKVTATLAAAAVALTTVGAAPVHADNKDTARLAAAILGIAIIGKIIHDRKEDDRVVTRTHRVEPAPVYRPRVEKRRRHDKKRRVEQPRYDRIELDHARPVVKPKRLPSRVEKQRAKLLPKNCFRSWPTNDGTQYVFGRSCLKKNFGHVQNLPRHCDVKFRSHGKLRRGYSAHCLRDEGYALARG